MLLEVWLLILLGGTTDSILACQSVPGGQRDMWLHHYPITPPLWRQTQPGLISGRVRIEAAALAHPSHTLALLGDQTPPQAKKKVKRKKIKSNTVLFFTVFPSLWQTWDFRREKEAFFSARSRVWMSPFRSFVGCENLTAWVTIYAKRSVRKWRPTQLAKC